MTSCADRVGTPAGYQRHNYLGTEACPPCLEARRRDVNERRLRQKYEAMPNLLRREPSLRDSDFAGVAIYHAITENA